MMKRSILSSLLIFAYALILAHSIIPHHHHEAEHHHFDQAHHTEDHTGSESSLSHSLSLWAHGNNTSETIIHSYGAERFVKAFCAKKFLQPASFEYFAAGHFLEQPYAPPATNLYYPPALAPGTSLRGPPSSC